MRGHSMTCFRGMGGRLSSSSRAGARRSRGQAGARRSRGRAGARRSAGTRRGLGGVLASVALVVPLAAHDHWIAPSSFRPALGERVDVRLCVGHPAEFQEQPRDPRRIVRFERVGPGGAQPIVGLDGRSPAGFFALREAGTLWLVYQSNHAFVEIEPAAYARYLEEEGLDEVRAERERLGEAARPGRDSYLRCDKALLQVGPALVGTRRIDDAPLTGYEGALGLPIELVLESDPSASEAAELV